MLFNSLTFLIFFVVVMAAHRAPLSWTTKKLNLLLASYLFYAAWNPPFVLLIFLSTGVDWVVARRLARVGDLRARRGLLGLSLAVNLGMLGFFKYGSFLLENFVALLAAFGVSYRPAAPDIVLPVGISFYTFQTLSYTIDVYRGVQRPRYSLLDFALYVSFFPQLVAGPIVRSGDFLPQCAKDRRPGADDLGWGLALLTLGLFQKTVLADGLLALVSDQVFRAWETVGVRDAWTGTLAFSCQIFFDFAGYSTCAVGIGRCLGFRIPENFRGPYGAIGFSDFWRRWHVSLSSWLRDYLYISLGGSRRGRVRTYANLMTTMLLGGLWHGASWRFVAWGGFHGLLLIAERGLRRVFGGSWALHWPALRPVGAVVTFLLVTIAWVPFRADSFAATFRLLRVMLGTTVGGETVLGGQYVLMVAVTAALLVIVHATTRDVPLGRTVARLPWWARGIALGLLLFGILLAPGERSAFIYFQF